MRRSLPEILCSVLDICFHVSGRGGCHRYVHGAAARDPVHHGPRSPAACRGHRVPEQRPLGALDADPSLPLHLPRLHLSPERPGPRPDQIGRREPAWPPHRPSGLQDPAHPVRPVKECWLVSHFFANHSSVQAYGSQVSHILRVITLLLSIFSLSFGDSELCLVRCNCTACRYRE